ncbi:DUF692 domain-containing protein [Xanthobacter sp. V3C-3]|uniref:MNIO family bufferin maturase n=1 Tax=Xanthobacter lutulentifluminis TaxID=3119935 RepID=UPI0037294D59
MADAPISAAIPPRAGVGLKPQHYRDILGTAPDVGFFEIHAENYMGDGGPPLRYLDAIRARYPVSLHGVGLSIGAAAPLDRDHLARLKRLIARCEPGLFSEHLAWSTHDAGFLNDLLPLPYTPEALDRICDHVDEVQATLGRRMLLENPSTYVVFAESTIPEVEFLAAVAARTGCGLLLDVANVAVTATNQGTDPLAYLADFPMDHVGEIHLAGSAEAVDAAGARLLIDAHGSPVAPSVWELYARVIERIGAVPTLIEWDNDVPGWPVLMDEARRADAILKGPAPAALAPAGGRHVPA